MCVFVCFLFYVCVFICVFIYLSECPYACTGNMHVCVGAMCSQITMPLATIIHQRRSGKRRWHRSLTKNFLTILAQNSKIQITSDWKIRIKKNSITQTSRGVNQLSCDCSPFSLSLCACLNIKGWTDLINNACPAVSVLWTLCLTRTEHFCLICDQCNDGNERKMHQRISQLNS